ncbi:MAG TPA: leucine--tRNA ligase [Polyangiaceae bacterium]|nr:leucine--tRNA ligase [Polyangiaceae bacterium]
MSTPRPRYTPADVEPKWQRRWDEAQTFRASRTPGRPKKYVLDMFPYPSGAGLHVGHPEGYTATDILSRYYRMRGFDVLHPMGWDAFGLPAEQYAVRTGTHPAVTTERNVATFKRQLKSLGFSYDWSREINTTDPDYVRWTQWIFLRLFARGLAYQAEIPVNWCPALGTVLANEEVIDGKSEIGGHPVERLPLRQWMLRITAYADRLERDLEGLDWPETRQKQRDWIGRSEGAELKFELERPANTHTHVEVFTTRPDTLYGATYLVLAPEHPLTRELALTNLEVEAYCARAKSKSDLARTAAKDKTGVFTGAHALHPLTGERLPIWVADFVLGAYGTGAIMSVPGHDERDFEFAKKFGLPVVEVVSQDGALHDASTWKAPFTGDGRSVRSPLIDGLPTPEAKAKMIAELEARGLGQRRVQYKLRDWVFSRQRYWGEPIPIYFPVELGEGTRDPREGPHTIRYDQPIAVDDAELPLRLPDLKDFSPGSDPAGALARAADWRYFQRDGRWYARETNTMPQWAGSCWYYLRFLDPKNERALCSREAYDAWMPVDVYVGGAEHGVLHLFYARFWHKVLFDEGIVTHPEPFHKLVHQGMILGYAYRHFERRDEAGALLKSFDGDDPDVEYDRDLEQATLKSTGEKLTISYDPTDLVELRGETPYLKGGDIRLAASIEKMSKSRGNVINPDDIVRELGADTLRVYEMFMGPLEQVKPWQTKGAIGVRRFLDRAWNACAFADASAPLAPETERLVHRTVKKVGDDIEAFRFNTAVSALMILVNHLGDLPAVPAQAAETFARLLAPFAPHLAEELWERLGHRDPLASAAWPSFDPALVVDDVVEIGVQVNGKTRSRVSLRRDAPESEARAAIAQDPALKPYLEGKAEKRFLYVPGKIINVVVA